MLKCARAFSLKFPYTVKLGFKERLNKEQLGNIEPFPMTNMPVHLTNGKQIIEQLCNDRSSLLPSSTVVLMYVRVCQGGHQGVSIYNLLASILRICRVKL